MRALTLTEPWASLLAFGEKRVETRSWDTSYRGVVAIHAAKDMPPAAEERATLSPFCEVLAHHGIDPTATARPRDAFRLGFIIGTATLVRVESTDSLALPDLYAASLDRLPEDARVEAARLEHVFGDFGPGRYAWLFRNPSRFGLPIAARGALGLWKPDLATQRLVSVALS